MCDHTVWDVQIEALADVADAHVMEWGVEHTSLVKMAEAVLAAAPERFALAGHSMGGRVAFEVYRLAPERVTRFAVMNTGVIPRAAGEAGMEEERGRRRLLDIAFQQGIRAMAMEWLKGMVPVYRQNDGTLVEPIFEMFERKTPELFLIQQEALLGRRDARPVLGTIRCPALVLTGGDDVWSPPAAHEAIAAGIAGAKLVIVPKSGHMSTMERPAEVAAAMREWLS
jgi:pimeloyl-ACP methyl ester carboxylesterase